MSAAPRPRLRSHAVRVRLSASAVAAMGVAIALAGCVGGATSASSATPNRSASASASATPAASSTPTASAAPWTPVSIACGELLTADQVYQFNPNFVQSTSFSPGAGTLAAKIASNQGVACEWVNETSGQTLDVAVGEPPASTDLTLKNTAVTTSNPVPTYGVPPQVEAYFTTRGQNGEVQAFTGGYWVTVVSPAFAEPGDATPIMTPLLANLPKQ